MNFRLVFMLALLGVLVAVVAVFGLVPTGWGTGLSIVAAIVTAGTLATRAPGKFFLHGLMAGGIGSALTSVTQVALFNQYLAHNPKAIESLKMLPAGMSPQVLVLAITPLTAGFSGLITGVLTLLWAKFSRPKAIPTQES